MSLGHEPFTLTLSIVLSLEESATDSLPQVILTAGENIRVCNQVHHSTEIQASTEYGKDAGRFAVTTR